MLILVEKLILIYLEKEKKDKNVKRFSICLLTPKMKRVGQYLVFLIFVHFSLFYDEDNAIRIIEKNKSNSILLNEYYDKVIKYHSIRI